MPRSVFTQKAEAEAEANNGEDVHFSPCDASRVLCGMGGGSAQNVNAQKTFKRNAVRNLGGFPSMHFPLANIVPNDFTMAEYAYVAVAPPGGRKTQKFPMGGGFSLADLAGPTTHAH